MFSLYLHIPFCIHRCAYCDFNTYAGLDALMPAYVDALCCEVEILTRENRALPVHTLYFGGGTPSRLPLPLLARILHVLDQSFSLSNEAEISLEANPGALGPHYLDGLRALGFNRLSLGMQTARPEELRLLERQHDYGDVVRAVTAARQAGFDNLSLDLIFGIPGQTILDFERSLALGLNLNPQHLSLYSLTIEERTPLHAWAARGLFTLPDPDLAADMYEVASDRLAATGYEQYEISNWARPGFACRHNLQYWLNQPYLGLGAGAHGYAAGVRTADVLHPAEYIRRLGAASPELPFPQTPATEHVTPIDRAAEIAETMMMGLRLTQEGVSEAAFRARFGQSLLEVFTGPISRLISLGLLEWAGDRLRLTERGRLLGNQVFVEFV
jgi:oxygen-independent coproporphyrinogen III oxidase